MSDAGDSPAGASSRGVAAWDRVWLHHSYRLPHLRAQRARNKVAAAIEAGLKFTESDRVLDLAGGSGHTLIEATERLSRAGLFVACDISGVATRLARANFERASVDARVLRAEWLRLPFRAGSFDKVLAFMFPEPGVLSEIDRVLARHGKVFVVAPCRHSITSVWYRMREAVRPGPFGDRRNYTARQLLSLVEGHFVVEAWRLWHSGSDRPVAGAVDRALARLLPLWGRYIVLRCGKSEPL